ncbi:MAG: DUF4038 domain-containing protein [Planctomycetota bacterium]
MVLSTVLLLATVSGATEDAGVLPHVQTWQLHEVVLNSSRDYEDSLRDVRVTLELTSPDGKTQSASGFWDGGRTWRVRVAPGLIGRWRWKSICSDTANSGLHSVEGAMECVPYAGENPLYRHGPQKLSDDRTHFEYADGTPYFWLACTAWNGALSPELSGWKEYLADRAAKKFTAIQFVMTQWRAAEGDRTGQKAFEGREKITLNPRFFQRMDRMVDAVNEHGLVAAPVLLWAIQDQSGRSPGSNLPDSECILLARYMVARYGAHHVIWILGGDGKYGGENAPRWKKIGRSVFDSPHRRLATLHPGGMNWVGDEFRDEPWYDWIGYQSGHGDDEKTLRWLISGPPATTWANQPVLPVINMEPNYEGHVAYQSRNVISDFMVRRASYWSLLIAPTAGVTYGAHGIWYFSDVAEVPLAHSRAGVAPPWRDAMKLPGSTQMKYLRELFDGIEWMSLRPAGDLVVAQPGKSDASHFIAAARSDDGTLVVIYTPEVRELHLNLTGMKDGLRLRWFNPRTGDLSVGGPLTVDDSQATLRTPSDGDWVLVLEKSATE